MKKKPRPTGEGVINARITYFVVSVGLLSTALLVAIFFIALRYGGLVLAQTMVFTGLILFEFVKLALIRSQEKLSIFSNKWLLRAMGFSLLLQLLVLTNPLASFFGVKTLFEIPPMMWLMVGAFMFFAWFYAKMLTRNIAVLTPQDSCY